METLAWPSHSWTLAISAFMRERVGGGRGAQANARRARFTSAPTRASSAVFRARCSGKTEAGSAGLNSPVRLFVTGRNTEARRHRRRGRLTARYSSNQPRRQDPVGRNAFVSVCHVDRLYFSPSKRLPLARRSPRPWTSSKSSADRPRPSLVVFDGTASHTSAD